MATPSKSQKKRQLPVGQRSTDLAQNPADDKNSLKFAGLDPVMGTLGVMIGLLTKDTTAADTYYLVPNWFTNPYETSQEGINKNSRQFGQLLGQLLGNLGGNALGVPEKDPAILGTWYPIQIKEKAKEGEKEATYKPTGLYLISIDNKTEEGEDISNAIGIGVLKKWEVIEGISVDVWASLPLVVIKENGDFALTFIDKENINPITLGIAVEGTNPDEPIIKENHISFNGVKFSGNIFLAPEPKFEVGLEVLSLQLADDDAPRNYSLADLEAITPLEILDTAVNLFVGALANQFPTKESELFYFAPLFGFSGRVPGSTTKLPLLQWVKIIENAVQHGDPSVPFLNWFNEISSTPDLLPLWMSCFSGFLGIEGTPSGQGNRTQPYQTPIIKIGSIGQLNFTVGTDVSGAGVRYFYPGFSFTSESLQIATSPAYFMVEADLELAQFQLSGTDSETPSTKPSAAKAAAVDINAELSLNFVANIKLTGKDGGLLLDKVEGISLGQLSGGLAIGALSGKIVPHFELINLTLPPQFGSDPDPDPAKALADANKPPNEFGVVNLLSTDQLAKVGAVAVSGELQRLLLGDGTPPPGPFRKGVAVLLGLIAPDSAPKETWPAPPFGEVGIPDSIKDPIHAWAQYYLTVIESKAVTGNVRPFTYMLRSFAQMLQVGDVAVELDGGGTPTNPWSLGLSLNNSDLPAHLTAYEVTDNGDVALVFGLNLAPEIVLGGVKIVPSLAVDAVHLNLPQGKAASATWLHGITANLSLPEKVTTPKLGDFTVSVDQVALSGGWFQSGGWSWSMRIQKPELVIGNNTITGADLDFSDQTGWRKLVEESAATFGPFFTGVMGIGLMRTNTRPGLLLAAGMGLLTDFSSFPIFTQSGLKWEGFNGLSLKKFDDPLAIISDQLASNFATEELSKEFLALLSWVLTGIEKGPDINGSGTFLEPFQMPLPAGLDVPVWYDTATQVLGMGLAKNLSYTYNEQVKVSVSTRVNALEYDLKNRKAILGGDAPSFFLEAIMENPDASKNLVDLPASAGHLGKLVIGVELSISDQKLVVQPIVTLLNTQLDGQKKAADITLAEFTANPLQFKTAFMSLLNTGLQVVFDKIKEKALFQDAYQLLGSLGLALPVDFKAKTPPSFGINEGGWQALLADPLSFLETQFLDFLGQSDARLELISLVNDLTGLNLPTEPIPLPILQLLSGLGLLGSADDNYPLLPRTWLQLVTDPVTELKSRFENLFGNTENRKQLAKALTKNIKPTTIGKFSLSANSNGVVDFSLPLNQAINIGSLSQADGTTLPALSLHGSLDLSFADDSLSVSFYMRAPILELSLENTFTIELTNGQVQVPVPAISLVWGDGKKPSAAPFQILPLPTGPNKANFYLDQFANLAPAYAINVILNAVFESELVQKYPVVQQIFKILGIAQAKKAADPVKAELLVAGNTDLKMGSIIGLLTHPLDWLLSDDVLGNNGRFDIVKLVQELAKIPQKSFQPKGASKPITIGPSADNNGTSLTGLPYGFHIDITGDTTTGKELATFSFGSDEVDLVNKVASLNDLKFSVSITPTYQAAVSGGVKLATPKAGGLFLDFGYNDSFNLSFGDGTPQKPGAKVQFLPFAGWGALAGQSGTLAATKIIEGVVPVVLNKLEPSAPKFVGSLRTFGTDVPLKELLDSIAKVISDDLTGDPSAIGPDLEKAALDWLKGIFDAESGQLSKTTEGIVAIFSNIPKKIGTVIVYEPKKKEGDTETNSEGLMVFSPGEDLPIKIFFGLNEEGNLGLWVGLQIPKIPYLSINILRTGVGVDLATLSKISFNFGASVIVPIDGKTGPGLSLTKDNTTFFKLTLDPVANEENPSKFSRFAAELAPKPFEARRGTPPNQISIGDAAEDWVLEMLKYVLPRYVSLLVLNNSKVKDWLEYNLFTPIPKITFVLSAADLLLATTVILQPDGKYILNSIDELEQIEPLGFISRLMHRLLQDSVDIVKIGEKGAITIGPRPGKNPNQEYGINISVPNFKIKSAQNIVLQLGAEDNEWITNTVAKGSPEADLAPGIQFYLPIIFGNKSVTANFHAFNIVLANIGIDIIGKNGQPLVDLTRFKLGGVEPRVLLDIKFKETGGPDIVFGGNLTLADMSLSLAPSKLDGAKEDGKSENSSNPIASNLLGSGSESETSAEKKPTANPNFSMQAAFTEDFAAKSGKLWVNLASSTSQGKQIIFPVQRSFGPLFIDDLGVGWNDTDAQKPLLDILFSGNVDLAGLKVELIGLDVGIPVKTPTDFGAYEISLKGLDVSYKGGAVTINGGLLKQDDPLQYTGAAVIKASSFSVLALGSYAQIKDADGKNVTSLFIFGALDIPLGGPPAFFITGLAAGFGFNRSIKIPSIEGVMDFPLITGVLNGTLSGGEDPDAALATLGKLVAPSVGEYWLAAGLKFRSFELINTAALLFIKFGKDFEIDILGLSYAALPPGMTKGNSPLAYFELALKIAIKPAAGVISVEAQLTPNSYVLTKECKVTGGFAFYLWFKNTTQKVNGSPVTVPKGQFVITLGGYHPRFKAPVYYPTVPRLGLMWKMDFSVGSLSISGGTYFAICPTAVMAGGYLDAVFKAGPLKAWLNAYANFLIEWKPFHFDVGIGITVGVSFGTTIGGVDITLSIEMSAKLQLAGPPIGGQVEIDWVIISFTIPFGDNKPSTSDNNLGSWDAFAESFLPQPPVKKTKPQAKARAVTMLAAVKNDDGKQQIIKWNAGSGLLNPPNKNKEAAKKAADNPEIWQVDTMFYSFNVSSVIPINLLTTQLDKTGDNPLQIKGSDEVGVRPMGFGGNLQSPVTITVTSADGTIQDLKQKQLIPTAILDGSPDALWSQTTLSKGSPPDGSKMLIKNTLVGATITADTFVYQASIPKFKIINLEDTSATPRLLPFAYTPNQYQATTPLSQDKPFSQIKNSIMSAEVVETRNNIYQALATIIPYTQPLVDADGQPLTALQKLTIKSRSQVAIDAPLSPDLSVMAHSAELIFQVFPIMAPIGVFQNKGQTTPPTPYNPSTARSLETNDTTPKQPVLEGMLRRHTASPLTANAQLEAGSTNNVNAKWTNRNQILLNRRSKTRPKARSAASNNLRRLYEGGAFLWRVDENQIHFLSLEGDLTALAFCFDKNDNLLAKIPVQLGQRTTLAANTAQVAVLAHDSKDHPTVGWRLDSRMIKINSRWSMTDGCLLATQNAQRWRFGRSRDQRGIVKANRLLAQNKVLNREDELVDGWLHTTCFTDQPLIGILLEEKEEQLLQVKATANGLPHVIGGTKCKAVLPYGDLFLHLYPVEQQKGVKQEYAGVLIKSQQEGLVIHGVMSSPKVRKNTKLQPEKLYLSTRAITSNNSEIKSSELTLSM